MTYYSAIERVVYFPYCKDNTENFMKQPFSIN